MNTCKLSIRLFSYTSLVLLLSFLAVHPAYADEDPYFGLKLGYTHFLSTNVNDSENRSVKFKQNDTTALGGVIGMSYKAIPFLGLRTDLEYMYRFPTNTKIGTSPNITGKLTSHTALANMYIDFYVLPFISVYVGGGIGLSVVELTLKNNVTSGSKTSPYFAAQAGGGLQFILLKHLVFDLNVRYLYLGDWKRSFSGNSFNSTLSGVETTVGIAYRF